MGFIEDFKDLSLTLALTPTLALNLTLVLRMGSDSIMNQVRQAEGGGYSWETWFKNGDPFAKHNDSEKTGAVHLERHGVDIGQANPL